MGTRQKPNSRRKHENSMRIQTNVTRRNRNHSRVSDLCFRSTRRRTSHERNPRLSARKCKEELILCPDGPSRAIRQPTHRATCRKKIPNGQCLHTQRLRRHTFVTRACFHKLTHEIILCLVFRHESPPRAATAIITSKT